MSIELAKAKLKTFYQAAVDLEQHWNEVLNSGYPMDQSFDEWLVGLRMWMEIVERGWPAQISVLLYDYLRDEPDIAILVTQDSRIVQVWISRPESQIDPSKLTLVQYLEWGTTTPETVPNYGQAFKFRVTKPDLIKRIHADWQENSPRQRSVR